MAMLQRLKLPAAAPVAARVLGAAQRFLCSPAEAPAVGGVQVTTLANGVTVATEESASPGAVLSVSVAAGSRCEGPESVGVTHVLKEMAFQSTEDRTAFAIQRESENKGLSLSASNDREAITYSATFLRDSLKDAVDNLTDASIGQVFHPWEVAASKARVSLTLDGQSTEEAVMDALHAGAFRSALGRPVFCPGYKVAAVSSADLAAFTDAHFTGGNITISGTGVDHDTLVALVEDNFEHVPADDSPAAAATYYGDFESRIETLSATASYAVAFEGAAAGSAAEVPTAVLAQMLGAEGHVKWGTGFAANKLAAQVPDADVSAFSLSYSDTGLFGVTVTAEAEGISGAVDAVLAGTKAVLAGDFTDADLASAKNQMARAVLDADSKERLAFMTSQLANTKQPVSPEEYADKILAVTAADVKAAAASISASKPTVAASGNLGYAPYASDLAL